MFDQNLIVGLVVLAVVVLGVYAYAPKLKGVLSGMGLEGFANGVPTPQKQMINPKARNGGMGANMASTEGGVAHANPHAKKNPPAPSSLGAGKEGFADFASVGDSMGPVPMAASQKPQGCYPREQLNPMDLLPNDPNSQWAQVNPQGAGDIQGKNFLSAGALIGINTIGQSLRNANLQLRAEPPCPQVQVGPWNQTTIEPDLIRKPLE
jgi:hypothetical protein